MFDSWNCQIKIKHDRFVSQKNVFSKRAVTYIFWNPQNTYQYLPTFLFTSYTYLQKLFTFSIRIFWITLIQGTKMRIMKLLKVTTEEYENIGWVYEWILIIYIAHFFSFSLEVPFTTISFYIIFLKVLLNCAFHA